jgi:hypothetical protein
MERGMTEGQETAEDQPVHFFIHIPKCGGNTFSDFLAKQFPLNRIYTAEKSIAAWEAHRTHVAANPSTLSRLEKSTLLRQRYLNGMRHHDLVIENHYAWDIAERLEQHRPLITYVVFREPKERVASHYLHLRRIPLDAAHSLAPEAREDYDLAKQLSLSDYCQTLDRSDVWSTVFNRQTRMMSSALVTREWYEAADKEAFFANALANLERADFVGDLKDLDEFAQLISLANGWLPPGPLGMLNANTNTVSPVQQLAAEVPDEVVAHDMALTAAAARKYEQWKRRVLMEASVALWRDRQRALATTTADSHDIDFCAPLHGINFHGREGSPPNIYRWMGPARTSQLFVPVRPRIPQHISVFIAAMIDPDLLTATQFCIDGSQIQPSYSIADNCTVAMLPISAEASSSGLVTLTITTPLTASDRDKGLGSDTRQKSLALRRIRVHP